MSRVNSTAPSSRDKPSKPYPTFPLYAHATRRWAKKIRGKLHYFGPWDDPDGALKKYDEQKEDLEAGRKPREHLPADLTVKDLVNAFLNFKKSKLDKGELSPRTWINYKETGDLLIGQFGKRRLAADVRPDDFADLQRAMEKRWGPVRVRNYIQQVRSVFKFGFESELLVTPVRFGPGFVRPSKKALRIERAKRGVNMFTAEEIRLMLAGTEKVKPTASLRAMILLGANCGYGNADVGTLPMKALDLENGWITYPRPKTGVHRRAALWPETVEALKVVLAARPEPKDVAHSELVFITQTGQSWHKNTGDNPISKEMRKLLNGLGIKGHRNFYSLRHGFETVAGGTKDQITTDFIMGHAKEEISAQYREWVSDERLLTVSDHVRKWVLGEYITC